MSYFHPPVRPTLTSTIIVCPELFCNYYGEIPGIRIKSDRFHVGVLVELLDSQNVRSENYLRSLLLGRVTVKGQALGPLLEGP